MMRCYFLVLMTGFLLVAFMAKAEDGKAVFDALHCGNCHKVDTGKTNPSLNEIALAYKGKEDQLLSYFKGDAESLIDPEKGDRMKRYIEKTKALSDGERKTLVDFILGDRG